MKKVPKDKLGIVQGDDLKGLGKNSYVEVFHNTGLLLSTLLQELAEKSHGCPNEYMGEFKKENNEAGEIIEKWVQTKSVAEGVVQWKKELAMASDWFYILCHDADYAELDRGRQDDRYWKAFPKKYQPLRNIEPKDNDKMFWWLTEMGIALEKVKKQAFQWLSKHWWDLWD